MTPHQIDLVQSSYEAIASERDTAGRIFYDRLFEVAPGVRALFSSDIDAQGKKLIDMLGIIVDGLTDLEKLLPAISQMASRHHQYGARPEHYPVVGEVLIWTFAEVLGDAFTPETETAWTAAYAALSEAMIDATHPDMVVAKLSAAE
ncbi:globin family protein [Amaricoccus macauensis]|uniref:globin family protein n=1 Tax=Amaricoccus macauensis TaxID=57001 RepID=UPI003C7D04B7